MYRRTRELIYNLGLHESTPVKLWPLEDLFPIRRDDLSWLGCSALILNPPYGWPATVDNQARVVIDHSVPDEILPMVYAHEVGHGICHHAGVSQLNGVNTEREEIEAWQIAAMLLIPERVVYSHRECTAIAAECGVSPYLVNYSPYIARSCVHNCVHERHWRRLFPQNR